MSSATDPIGAPDWQPATEERTFRGPANWTLPARAHELAPLLKVEVVSVRSRPRQLGTLESVTVAARGKPRELARYWKRLDEIAGTFVAREFDGRKWGWRTLRTLRDLLWS